MHNKIQTTLVAVAALSAAGCASHYQMAEVSRSRILIDNRYDKVPDTRAEAFIAPFKASGGGPHGASALQLPAGESALKPAYGHPHVGLSPVRREARLRPV